MGPANPVDAVNHQLQRYRGTDNVALWLKMARILAKQGLELTVGKTRIASLKTPVQFRDTLDRLGLNILTVRALFAGIVDRWTATPFTGMMDIRRAERGVSRTRDASAVLSEMILRAETPPGADAHPLTIGPRIPQPEVVISKHATHVAFSLVRIVSPDTLLYITIPPATPSEIAGRIRYFEQRLRSIRRSDRTVAGKRKMAEVLIGIAREQWGAANYLGAALAYNRAGDYAHLYARHVGLLEDYLIARDYYDRAIECSRDIELRQLLISSSCAGQVQVAVAVHTENILDWEKAVSYFEQAASSGEHEAGKVITAATLLNIGHCYWEAAKLGERIIGKKETRKTVAGYVAKAGAMAEGAANLLVNLQDNRLYSWAIYCASLSYDKLRRIRKSPAAAAKAIPLLYYSGRRYFKEEIPLLAAQCFRSAGDCLSLLGLSEQDALKLRRSASLLHLAARLFSRCQGEHGSVANSFNEASKTMRRVWQITQDPQDCTLIVWFALLSIRSYWKVGLTVATIERMTEVGRRVVQEQELITQISKEPADVRLLILLAKELAELAGFARNRRLESGSVAVVRRAEILLRDIEKAEQAPREV